MQIYETFTRVFPKEYTIAVSNLDKLLTRAEKVEEMKTLLSAGQAKIIMTTKSLLKRLQVTEYLP